MRRKDKAITDTTEIAAVIQQAQVCRLAMTDGEYPYVVPMCFGYHDGVLYFHSANKGRKLDILKRNNRVCFEFDIDATAVPGRKGCEWGMRFKSVIGFGKAQFIEDRATKRAALDTIVRQYTNEEYPLSDKQIENTVVIRVDIEAMTGKKS